VADIAEVGIGRERVGKREFSVKEGMGKQWVPQCPNFLSPQLIRIA